MKIIKQLLKQNFTKGRGKYKPEIIIDHITDGTETATIDWFNSSISQVSSHYLITKDLKIIQFVEEADQAWGAGLKVNPTAKIILERPNVNPNEFSIHIEHESKTGKLSEEMYKLSAKLHKDICERWNIFLDLGYILPHNSIRRDKTCPKDLDILKIIQLAREEKKGCEDKDILIEALKKENEDYKQANQGIIKWIASFFKSG